MTTLLIALVILLVLWFGYFFAFLRWHQKKTAEDTYYRLPQAERLALKKSIKRHAPLLLPIAHLIAKIANPKRLDMMSYKGFTGPAAVASEETYAKTENYPSGKDDIFIATQMKCGTTWMQQLVFEVLHKGKGDLSDDGYKHMYALSPWIETTGSVSIENAPLVSNQKKHIIKTHMPIELTPYSPKAKYIYVTRHPVSCFASIVDFMRFLTGPFCPSKDDLLDWYLSDDMFWGHWAGHVNGWWQLHQEKDNVLFIHFEAIKKDPAAIIRMLAHFLEVELTNEEVALVAEKSSFSYMQEHEELFEMSPPNIFSVTAGENNFMKSGTSSRHEDINEADKQRIIDFMKVKLKGTDYPAGEFYQDLK